MTARALLVRGLLAGVLAGFATFLVAYQVGEPHVDAAIALEEAGTGHHHDHDHDATASHDEADAVVSRDNQRTWGLLTATLAVGTALGGLVALVAAAAVGRLGRMTPAQSTATVALLGFVSVALVPFLKYPASPPGVGAADTIGDRSASYFTFLLLSVVAAVLCTLAAHRLAPRLGTFGAVVAGAAAYVVLMVLAGQVMPTVDEVADFPADTLWYFRRASLITLATMWAVLGVGLTGLVGRLYRQESARTARRELAAAL